MAFNKKYGYNQGKNNPAYRGGRFFTEQGYIRVLCSNHPNRDNENYVLEHRLVMEKHLGRYLTTEEIVHHINGIKDDNRLENLMLFKNAREHRKYHWGFSDQIIQEVIDYVKDNHTFTEASIKFKINYTTIVYWCRLFKITSQYGLKRKHAHDSKPLVKQLLSKKLSYREIIKQTGFSMGHISRCKKEMMENSI